MRMRCGWRWPHTTRRCVRRSRPTTVSSSATPVTAWLRRSPRRCLRSRPPIDAQRELQLPVRMGIATGEAELRDDDYFGTVLNRAARIMAAGHGGQILLAESTAGLLSGVDLVDLGPRRLRDVPNPVNVFQASGAGPAHGIPAATDARPDSGEPSTSGFGHCRTRYGTRRHHRGSSFTTAGHTDRRRWGRQDPACTRSRRSNCRTNFRTAYGFSSSPPSTIRRPCRRRWLRCLASLNRQGRP